MSVTDLLGRLDARFEVLTGGRRRRSRDRQRTLRETVDWSYGLLDADEQQAFATLSVFAGSFGLDGASAVLDQFDDTEVLDLVDALLAKSLLTVADVDGIRRYRYLETLRSYADERLAERGDTRAVRQRLHQFLCAAVVAAVEEVEQRSNRGAVRLRVEIPNLRRAFDDALDRSDVAAATTLIAPFLRLSGAIDWHIGGWAAEALALDGVVGAPDEPNLLALHAIDRWLDNELDDLRALAEQILDRAAAVGEVSVEVGDAALWIFQLTGDDDGVARLSGSLTAPSTSPDSYATLRRRITPLWTELVPARPRDCEVDPLVGSEIGALIRHPSEMARGIGFELNALLAQRTGDPEEMLSSSYQAEELLVEGSANWFAALQIRAWAQWELARMADAIRTADEGLEHAYRYGDRSAMIIPLAIYALVLRSLDEPEAAATVRGHLPRRLTVLLVAQLVDLDRWLSQDLEPRVRTELFARGAPMDSRQLQALTHGVVSRHLQLGAQGQPVSPSDAASGGLVPG